MRKLVMIAMKNMPGAGGGGRIGRGGKGEGRWEGRGEGRGGDLGEAHGRKIRFE